MFVVFDCRWCFQVGFDERYGARPLQRAIEQEIIAPLAKWLLNYPKVSNCTLVVDFQEFLIVNKK